MNLVENEIGGGSLRVNADRNEPSLNEYAKRIVIDYNLADECISVVAQKGKEAIEAAIRCGKHLLVAKELVKGNWLDWLKANCPNVEERTAQRYMKLANKSDTVSEKLKDCETLRQAYLTAGVIKETDAPNERRKRLSPEERSDELYQTMRRDVVKWHTRLSTTLPFPLEKQRALIEPLEDLQKAIGEFIARVKAQVAITEERDPDSPEIKRKDVSTMGRGGIDDGCENCTGGPSNLLRQSQPAPATADRGRSLREHVIEVLRGAALTKGEVLDAVQKRGYKFSTNNPFNSIGTILYGRDPKFNLVDGKFSLSNPDYSVQGSRAAN